MTDVYTSDIDDIIQELFEKPKYHDILLKFIFYNKLFSKHYYKLVCSIKNNSPINKKLLKDINNEFDKIDKQYTKINKNLYICDLKGISNICILKSLKINNIVSLTKKDFYKSDFINYTKISIDDSSKENFIQKTFKIAVDVADWINQNHIVMVNCNKGLSRSVCFVIMILMIYGYSFNDAYNFIKNKRYIQPNPSFLNELSNFKPQ
jgi:protein-tyrosine phosphatase